MGFSPKALAQRVSNATLALYVWAAVHLFFLAQRVPTLNRKVTENV